MAAVSAITSSSSAAGTSNEDELQLHLDHEGDTFDTTARDTAPPITDTQLLQDKDELVTDNSTDSHRQAPHIRRYFNEGGHFVTGIDINSTEYLERRTKREQRFGTQKQPLKIDEKLNQRAERFGIDVPIVNGERIKYVKKLPDIPEGGDVREEAILVHGTDEMSTKEVLNYFKEYCPSHLEWIDDSSCLVVWEDATSAQRAWLGKGAWPVMEEKSLEAPPAGDDGEWSPVWRQSTERLLLRKATSMDVKGHNAAQKSRYYKKYGNPNAPFIQKKRSRRKVDLRQRLERKRDQDDLNEGEGEEDEEMETVEGENDPSELLITPSKQRKQDEGDTDTMETEQSYEEGGGKLRSVNVKETKPKNDLRHRLGKREELKSRLGPFPIM